MKAVSKFFTAVIQAHALTSLSPCHSTINVFGIDIAKSNPLIALSPEGTMKIKQGVLATVAVASTLAGSAAHALSVYPDFTINPSAYVVAKPDDGFTPTTFTADKITGNYVERATFNNDGTFAVSLRWNFGQLLMNDGQDEVDPNVSGMNTFGSSGYRLYALFKATGYVSMSGGKTFFNQTNSTAEIWIDNNSNTGFTVPADGTKDWILSNAADDKLLMSGTSTGLGTVDPSLSTCGNGGINCGSFGQTTKMTLTPLGKQFFVSPTPFYTTSYQSGQLNNISPVGTQTLNGSADFVFVSNVVPEPGSLALAGLGLMSLVAASRRRKSA